LFKRLGFTIKIQKFEKLWEASFCGLVFDPENLIIVTDPLEVIADFGWAGPRYIHCGRVRHLELLRAKSLSFAHQYPGCPIVQSLAQYGLRMTKHINLQRYIDSQVLSMWDRQQLLDAMDAFNAGDIKVREVASSTRDLVESVFGVTVSDQIRIERHIDAMNVLEPIDLGPITGASDDWRKYWDDYVMQSQGDFPVALSTRVVYDNIGELFVEGSDAVPGKACIVSDEYSVDVQQRLRPA